MAVIRTANPVDFISGKMFLPRRGKSRHNYRAKMNGRAIEVTLDGHPVKVSYGATADNRTVTAYVDGVGYIGGWQYPSKKRPWSDLVLEINRGILYHDSADMPRGRRMVGGDLEAIIAAANDVIDNWSEGDLAGAVNALEEALALAGKRKA